MMGLSKGASATALDASHTFPYPLISGSSERTLIDVIQDLSHARDLDTVAEIVREAARNLTGADGATFVLREGNNCYYADENAITPLWKGRRFPMSMCISGWVMTNAAPVKIKDIYNDSRVPIDAYRPTFVKSLAMVPIRKSSPIGAIGNYWADHHEPTEHEMSLLQALADTTSVALENVALYGQLQDKINELEESNFELSCFAWAASHDLQEPLRTITTQVELLEKRCKDKLDERTLNHIKLAMDSTGRLQRLIGDLVVHARSGKSETFRPVSLDEVVENVLEDVKISKDETGAQIECGTLPKVVGNQHLLTCLMRNIISNAIKFRTPGLKPHIKITSQIVGHEWLISVSDNGIGIPSEFQGRIFNLFQRAHPQDDYVGSGVGLATCKKITTLHSGRIWVESAPNRGSIFCFTLPVTNEKAE